VRTYTQPTVECALSEWSCRRLPQNREMLFAFSISCGKHINNICYSQIFVSVLVGFPHREEIHIKA
jgi:hypothetical protein